MTETTDTAVVLVAGIGSRLRPLTDNVPKALVPVGRSSILERAVFTLKNCGVTSFVFATGYRSDAVESQVKTWGIEAHFFPNPRFDCTQNSISLLRCSEALRGKSFYKLDGDLLFDPLVVERLSASKCPLAVAVDGKRKLDEEAMKVIVGKSREILKFGKAIPVCHAQGESIGIERLSATVGAAVLDSIDELERSGIVDRYYEDVYASLIEREVISAEAIEVGDLAWTEVDCPDDLERARAIFS